MTEFGKILMALDPVIDAELERAQFKRGKTFASQHEGYSVLQEELEECSEELHNAMRGHYEMWHYIRNDSDIPEDIVLGIECIAKRLAAEAVQVAAMAEKFMISMGEWEAKEEEK